MLKLNASYSKKVPADGEFTSQSYHASIEVELPDSLNQNELQNKIHATFEMVRNSVEAELHGNSPQPYAEESRINAHQNGSQSYGAPPAKKHEIPASPKQIKYMLDLARNKGVTPAQIAAQHGVASVEQLTKNQCSNFINSWRAA